MAEHMDDAGIPGTMLKGVRPGRPGGMGRQLDVILDIDLPMVVRFGHTEMTVEALTRIGEGSVIDLGRSPHEPVDLLVSGRMVARGEVVVVSGHYGVRILELVGGDRPDVGLEA